MRTRSRIFSLLLLLAVSASVLVTGLLNRPNGELRKKAAPSITQSIFDKSSPVENAPATAETDTDSVDKRRYTSRLRTVSSVLEVQSNDSKSEEGSKKYAAQVTEWMHEVGIPSEEQDEKYVVLSESELEELALQGDTIANIWLGLKRASSGDEDSAVAILQDAVVDGSIGAALTLANLYSGTTTPSFEANVLEAYAWFRVAQVMGDSNAMFMMFGGPDFTMEEYFLAEQNYFLLLTELQRDHQAQYGTPLPFNPRPTEETSNDP